MIIDGFDCQLRTIRETDLELIRVWRNSDHVRRNMIYREEISASEQNTWFENLNIEHNIYMIIHEKDQPVGILNYKQIDWQEGSGEGGVFIGAEDRLNTSTPLRALYAFNNMLFSYLGLSQMTMKVLKSNSASIRYCKSWGAEILGEWNEQVWQMSVGSSAYFYASLEHRKKYGERAGHDPNLLKSVASESVLEDSWLLNGDKVHTSELSLYSGASTKPL